jgi:hypothetical protein
MARHRSPLLHLFRGTAVGRYSRTQANEKALSFYTSARSGLEASGSAFPMPRWSVMTLAVMFRALKVAPDEVEWAIEIGDIRRYYLIPSPRIGKAYKGRYVRAVGMWSSYLCLNIASAVYRNPSPPGPGPLCCAHSPASPKRSFLAGRGEMLWRFRCWRAVDS